MELQQGAQQDLYARVATYLKQSFGELATPRDDVPIHDIWLGREGLSIGVFAISEDQAAVDVWRWVTNEIPVTFEVAKFLLRKNHEMRIGALGIDEEGDIIYQHSLFSEAVTKDSLATVVRVMAGSLDEIIDEMNMRFK